jgi:hypothetical protein
MTAAREAITLPIVLFAVTLIGGLRIVHPTALVPWTSSENRSQTRLLLPDASMVRTAGFR